MSKTKMELYGSELIQKEVRPSGDCGRVYVPLAWVGKKVKIILVD
ncbi:cytoplasmic protein [Desulfocarbo indianensis]|nr:cytoplasmic protein [Desulfocarbo indianensis]